MSDSRGLGAHRFTLSRSLADATSLPTAATCFNQLKLPQYETFEDLEAKVLVAIRHGCEGFQFV